MSTDLHTNLPPAAGGTLRLVYPQWQGADIAHWFPDYDPQLISQGYAAGSHILDLLLPPVAQDQVMRVPVRLDYSRKVQDGVMDRDVIAAQCKDALKLIQVSQAGRILILGGECAVSVPAFAYLKAKYQEDLCMLWLDAHPDITLPGDPYTGFHAMAVSALLGKGDPKILGTLPAAPFKTNEVLYLGLRDWERPEIEERQRQWGLAHLSPEQLNASLDGLEDFLSKCPCSKAVVHFDLDVLDPADLYCAVGRVDNGLTLDRCVQIIELIARHKQLVGLSVAELMPRLLLKLCAGLKKLPLISK